jgi:hypothetical protein
MVGAGFKPAYFEPYEQPAPSQLAPRDDRDRQSLNTEIIFSIDSWDTGGDTMENITTLHPASKPSSSPAPATGPVVSTAALKRKLLDQVRHAIRTLN